MVLRVEVKTDGFLVVEEVIGCPLFVEDPSVRIESMVVRLMRDNNKHTIFLFVSIYKEAGQIRHAKDLGCVWFLEN